MQRYSGGVLLMSELQNILRHAEQQCRNRGARLTEKRKMVLTGLLESACALSAYELLDYWTTGLLQRNL